MSERIEPEEVNAVADQAPEGQQDDVTFRWLRQLAAQMKADKECLSSLQEENERLKAAVQALENPEDFVYKAPTRKGEQIKLTLTPAKATIPIYSFDPDPRDAQIEAATSRIASLEAEVGRLREALPDPDELNSLATWLDHFCPKATRSGVQARVRHWARSIVAALRGEESEVQKDG